MTLAERMAEWPERWQREGVARGRREGVAEGVARQRAVLRRLAARRFGDAVGGELDAMLAETEDWDQLGAVADLILGAESGPEFTARVADLLGRS